MAGQYDRVSGKFVPLPKEAAREMGKAPPFVRVGGRCYYRLTDLRSWVDALEARQFV